MSVPAGIASRWIIESFIEAPLLVNKLGHYSAFDRSYFPSLDKVPVINFSQKLGHIYEDVCGYLLENSEKVTKIKKGVQVFQSLNKGRSTLGELDFLFTVDDELVHLEIAVKFYMGVEKAGSFIWYGPDSRDHWHAKREKLLTHQLSLNTQDAAIEVIEKIYKKRVASTCHLLLGCFFIPFGSNTLLPEGVSNTAEKGYWLRDCETDLYKKELMSEQFYIVPKLFWQCKLIPEYMQYYKPIDIIAFQSTRLTNCVMITNGVYKVFIVPDYWAQ